MHIGIDGTSSTPKQTLSQEIDRITIAATSPGVAHTNIRELVETVDMFTKLLKARTPIDAINNWVHERYNAVATVNVPESTRIGIPA